MAERPSRASDVPAVATGELTIRQAVPSGHRGIPAVASRDEVGADTPMPSSAAEIPEPLAHRIRRRIASLSEDLPDDEVAPDARAIVACEAFLEAISERLGDVVGFRGFFLTTMGDGDLHCTWDLGDQHLSLTFGPDGTSRLLVIRVDGPGPQILSATEMPTAAALDSWLGSASGAGHGGG